MKIQMRLWPLALAAITATAAGCGENNFGAGGGKRGGNASADATGGQTKTGTGKPGDEGDGTGGKPTSGDDDLELGPPDGATPEQQAIGKCLKAWGSNPFGKTAYTDFREIHAAVTVMGGGGYAIEDTEVTDTPKLIVIHAAVSVLGQADYLLMNPNGWYCLMVDVDVMSKSTIELQCKAHLADTKVNVNVGSRTQNAAAVGVAVFSDVKVERKRAAGEAPGC